jgi:DNA-binding XRE family transcriptional regulator
MSTDALSLLAQAVKERRFTLGLARTRAAELAGISKETWKRVEDGDPVREMNYAKIDQALGWAVGSCVAVKAGGSPTPVRRSDVDPSVVLADVSGTARDATVRRVVESASIGVTDLSAPEIRELSARIVGDLKREGII